MGHLTRSSLVDFVIFWVIAVLAYGVVGFLRGQQAIRGGLDWFRQDRVG
ncbi:MAG: hypothetical protein ACRDIY_15495 [Chloroflexota bacterium]